ncbi:lamin tail domain-containing protein [Longimonas halophila]|nr:lamin tail domain-containing protein [Longimonas halophila]
MYFPLHYTPSYWTRLRRLLLVAALLMAWLAMPTRSAAQSPPDVVINEIMYAPQPSQNEYIELYNRSDADVNLSELSYANGYREFAPVTDSSVVLQAGGYAVLVRTPSQFEAAFPEVPYLAPDGFRALRNSGDTVVLRYGETNIDEVTYVPSWSTRDDAALERVEPNAPSQAPFNWQSATAPAGGTPGFQNSVFTPDSTPPTPLFAQVDADARRITLTFTEPLNPASLASASFTGPERAPVSVEQGDANTVRLFYTEPLRAETLTVRGIRDWQGNSTEATLPLSYAPQQGDLVVTEIMYRPLSDDFDERPNQPEYFEVVNPTERWISLQGLFTTNRPRDTGGADTLNLGIGTQHVAPSGGYAVVYAEPNSDNEASSTLDRAFPTQDLSAPDGPTVIAVPRSRLGLRVQPDRLRLHRADGEPIATVDYHPDWHAPGVQDTRGLSLERISLTAPAANAMNWTSSAHPEGGTPGFPNSVGPPPAEGSTARVSADPSPFAPEVDQATRIQYALPFPPDWVQLRIFDAHGRPVRTVEETVLSGPEGEVLWDGRNDAGRIVRMGVYVVLMEAQNWNDGTSTQHRTTVVVARPL